MLFLSLNFFLEKNVVLFVLFGVIVMTEFLNLHSSVHHVFLFFDRAKMMKRKAKAQGDKVLSSATPDNTHTLMNKHVKKKKN